MAYGVLTAGPNLGTAAGEGAAGSQGLPRPDPRGSLQDCWV